MGRSSEDGDEDSHFKRYHEICASLNLDRKATDEAWQSYQRINSNYTLEGDILHWLACSLYVACRKASVPTVGGRHHQTDGNCVSLTRLLRSCKLSLVQFFIKMKKWADMEHLPPDMRQKVERLERNFSVSTVIFKKFEPIFLDIFKDPATDPAKPVRSRKQRKPPCTSSELFSFCWTLFVHVKGHFSAISDDLVNSYHLLLCCVDLMFSNAVAANRRDILKLNFAGLPEGFESPDYEEPTTFKPICIIEWLCENHQGLVVEAKGIKEHWWKPRIKRMIEKKILKGRTDNLIGLFEVPGFEFNCKSINKEYDSFVLNSGDFDERIFLGETANEEIGTPAKHSAYGSSNIPYQMELKTHIQKHLAEARPLVPSTPLTGRKYLKDKDLYNSTPVSMATQSVLRLQTLLANRKAHPSEKLVEIFNECSNNPQDAIMSRINDMGETFCTCFSEHSDEYPESKLDFAKKRLQLGQTLYFKALENIVLDEKRKLPLNGTLSSLLEHDPFHRSLFACCLEIVIFSYNSQRLFPWILEIFDLQPYYFYKVIEVLIRGESGLYRDVVKHLNHIEEQILESLAWKADSPLWEAIKASDLPIPSCEDVSLPAHLEPSQTNNLLQSPLAHPEIRKSYLKRSSPTSDRFGPNTGSSSARKCLFGEKTQPITPVKGEKSEAGANVAVPQQRLSIAFQMQGESGITYIPIVMANTTTPPSTPANQTPRTPEGTPEGTKTPKQKRTGSLALFFRKVYHMAGVRMRELFDRLGIGEEMTRKQIWTSFEHIIMNFPEQMCDRHIDQIIMCSIYVMCKVRRNNISFQEIMRCYRLQPQAASHVYRSVLIQGKKRRNSGSSENSKNGGNGSPTSGEKEGESGKQPECLSIRSSSTLPIPHPNSQPPTPTRLTGTGTHFEFEETRSDIVTFYNKVFVPVLENFAKKFSHLAVSGESPPLSPLPRLNSVNPMSPFRRVSDKHSVFISPLKNPNFPPSPSRPLSYSLGRSPAKDLRAINNMVRMGEKKVGKRILEDLQDEGENESPSKKVCDDLAQRKIQNVMTERQGGNIPE